MNSKGIKNATITREARPVVPATALHLANVAERNTDDGEEWEVAAARMDRAVAA